MLFVLYLAGESLLHPPILTQECSVRST